MDVTTAKGMDLRLKITNRQILMIALPISMAILIPQINFITNNIFLGGLGEAELGTAGITGVYYLIVAVIGNGLNNGLQSIISRRAGENNFAAIGRSFAQGIRISLFFAFAGILFTYCCAPLLMHSLLHSTTIQTQAIRFLYIRVWGLPFLYIYQMGNAFLVGTNNSRFLVIGTIAETIFNIVLDYGLIYGHYGLPHLGFDGAAYASVIAEIAGMLVVISIIGSKQLHRRFFLFEQFKFDKKLSWIIFKQSSPLMLQYVISLTSWLFFYILIEHHGEKDLAVSNTMRNIIGLFGVFTWAFASTTNTMVSNVIGQGMSNQVLPLIKRIMILSMSCCILVCILLNVFPHTFLSVYNQDEAFMQTAIPVLRMVTISVFLMSAASVWLNAVTGTGHTRINLGIEIAAITGYSIYVYLVMVKYNGSLLWAWGSEFVYWTITLILAAAYLSSGRWKDPPKAK